MLHSQPSSTPSSKKTAAGTVPQSNTTDGATEFKLSFVCLDKKVQSFMEESLNLGSSQRKGAENQTMEAEVHNDSTVSRRQVPHVPSSIFNQLGHACGVVPLDNPLSVVVHYGYATTPHDKLLEHRGMARLERGVESYGSAMVARERQPVAFASLGMATDPKEPCWYRPWDPGGPRQTRNTLRTRCFRMGIGML